MLEIKILTDGSAFDGDAMPFEINRLLDLVSKNVIAGKKAGIINDINGNRACHFRFTGVNE